MAELGLPVIGINVSESPAIGERLRDDGHAQACEGSQVEPDWGSDWDLAAQAAPDYEADQRINW